ncbi:hypothetical protein BO78DRAFT_466267 [Aspergillus sclerotiicarbonarius CBS 121057]|uniref:Zn(2)-C6 fungal-type domain-containing protein n=1 Tax=Aspergillus sclerotiicarbonarius (strain CBS 121057 / IBT 28362) TaxID=1448318 RepID=A0A319F6U5_ASPSB|nr:hypothetical protein BO78DRAFT_466267 [Aspergillus sclerotiicarbonarius CBS 121057]
MSSTSTSPPVSGKKRPRRVARACDNCRRQKIKCDAAQPRCNWCDHQARPCTYERKVKRSRRKTGAIQDVVESTSGPTPARDLIQGVGPLHLITHHVDQINICDGTVLFSRDGQEWVERLTGEQLPADTCSPGALPWENGSMGETENTTPVKPANVAYGTRPDRPARVQTAKISIWGSFAFLSALPLPLPSPMSPSRRSSIMESVMASINLLLEPHVDLLQAALMIVCHHLLSGVG